MSNTTFELLKKLSGQVDQVVARFARRRNQLAVQVEEILEQKGWTQRQLAEKAKMKESVISRLLGGGANPTLKTITTLEAALEQDIITFPTYVKDQIGDLEAKARRREPIIIYKESFRLGPKQDLIDDFETILKLERNEPASDWIPSFRPSKENQGYY